MRPIPQVTHVTRRWLLSSLSASLTLFGSGGMTYADGGGESSEELPSSSRNIDKNPPKKKSKKLSVIYTQKNLKNVRDKDLKTAIRGNKQGHTIVIEGFSKKMSSVIFELILLDRKAALRAINLMLGLRTRKFRRETLLDWLINAGIDYTILERKRDRKKEIDPNNPDLRRALRISELINEWFENPMEGLLKAPPKKDHKNKPKNSDTNAVTNFFTNLTGTEAPKNEDKAGSR